MFNKNSIFFYTVLLLVPFIINGCDEKHENLTVTFTPQFDELMLSCDSGFSIAQKHWKLSQLQFYISQIEVSNGDQSWHKADFIPSSSASKDIALIGGVCDQSIQWQVSIDSPIPVKAIRGIRYTLGVPQSKNHLNPLTQPAPLNQPDMFWTWQLGHKFLRLELASDSSEWLFHLGSTGCESASPVRPPKENCTQPNRPLITLENFSAGENIDFNIKSLVNGIDLLAENNCQSSPTNSICQQLLQRVGVNHEQQIFFVRSH